MVQLAEGASQDVESFGDHVKGAFGATWKGELCEGKLVEGSIDAGSPALLVISLGALRSLELLRDAIVPWVTPLMMARLVTDSSRLMVVHALVQCVPHPYFAEVL